MSVDEFIDYSSSLEKEEASIIQAIYNSNREDMMRHWPRREVYLSSAEDIDQNEYDVLATIENLHQGDRTVYGLELDEDVKIEKIREFE